MLFRSVGTDHWELRHTIVLPVALSLKLFGQNEFALALPNVLFFLGLIAVNHHYVRRYLNADLANLVSLLLACTPAFVVQATYINIDVVELFFVSLSFWLFVAARESAERPSLLVWSGVVAGLAFMARETTLALILFYGVCFLVRPGIPRSRYFLMILGFLVPIGLEIIYLGAMTGDLFYRYRLDNTHGLVDRVGEVNRVASSGLSLDEAGILSVNVWLDPILALFVSQKYGLLYYIAIPAAFWIWFTKRAEPLKRPAILLAAGLMATWILFISLSFPILYLAPRYHTVSAWAAVLITAYACQIAYRAKVRFLPIAGIVALVAVNGLSFYLENTTPRFAEYALVHYVKEHPGEVLTDPNTARRASVLLDFAGLTQRVQTRPATHGDVVVYSPLNVEFCSYSRCNFDAKLYQQKSSWIEIDRIEPRPRRIGALLRMLGLDKYIPAQIMMKIEVPVPGIVIYRLP